MKEDKKSRVPLNPVTRLPFNPLTRIPINPMSRIPINPVSRISGSSGKFFENFTTFKNAESNWNAKGFSKKIH